MKPAPKKAKFAPPSVSKKDAEKMAIQARIKANQPAPKPAPTPATKPFFDPTEKEKMAMDAKIKANQAATKPAPIPAPKPIQNDMEQVKSNIQNQLGKSGYSDASLKSAIEAESAKANKLAATPKTYMPQANTVPNAAMAAQQKMPPLNMVPPANARPMAPTPGGAPAMKRGGSVRNKPSAKFSSGGSTSKASSRGDGIAQRGKTKGRYI